MLNLNKVKDTVWVKPFIMVISIVAIVIAGIIGKHRETEYREGLIAEQFKNKATLEYISENIYIIIR